VPPPGQQPNVNKQQKTEDVTNTKGMSFSDFGLGQELQLVSLLIAPAHCKCANQLNRASTKWASSSHHPSRRKLSRKFWLAETSLRKPKTEPAKLRPFAFL
jgi:hypothetical protein